MPIYEYSDTETGIVVELQRHVEDRNKPIVLIRTKNIPDRISIHGLDPSDGDRFDDRVLKAYYKKEQKDGSRFDGKGFTKDQIKRAWTEKTWKRQ